MGSVGVPRKGIVDCATARTTQVASRQTRRRTQVATERPGGRANPNAVLYNIIYLLHVY